MRPGIHTSTLELEARELLIMEVVRYSSLVEGSPNNSMMSSALASSSSVLVWNPGLMEGSTNNSVLSTSLTSSSSVLVWDSSLVVSGFAVLSLSLALKAGSGTGLAGFKRSEVVGVTISSRELNRSHSLLGGKGLGRGTSQSLFNSSINGRLKRHHDTGDDVLLIQVGWHSIPHSGSTGCQPSKSKHT